MIFVLACGLRIVVRLGLVPLLRRKKAADGRARREPRRPTPTPMQSAREAPTGTKRRSCEREGVESAPTREELRKKIEDLGGLDVVESDPDAAKQLQDMMEASDQVLNANIVAARKTLKVVGDEVMKTNSVMKTIEEQQREQMKQQRRCSG